MTQALERCVAYFGHAALKQNGERSPRSPPCDMDVQAAEKAPGINRNTTSTGGSGSVDGDT